MSDQPQWIINEESTCIRKWADYLHKKAKNLFLQDGTHGSMMFLFKKEEGLVSVNLVPPKIDNDQLNASIKEAIYEHSLCGVVLIGETWTYNIKEKDHTAFQILTGEMRVSDLNDEDKNEALMVRMENSDGDCLIYLDKIIRKEKSVMLGEDKMITGDQMNWFIFENSN